MGHVYLIRNQDLYKIGHTENLERRIKQLQPCVLVQSLETDRSLNLERELHKQYEDVRLPQSEYFRLSEDQVEKVRIALGWKKPKQIPSKKPMGWKKPSEPLPESSPLPAQERPPAPQIDESKDDWWTIERKRQGKIRAANRIAQEQKKLDEIKEANRQHWESLRKAARERYGSD